MTKRVHLFIAVALVLLALSALGVGLFLITPRVSMRIEAYRTQGQTINATFEVDGVPSKEVRELPAEFEFKAKTLSYSIERSSGEKWIRLKWTSMWMVKNAPQLQVLRQFVESIGTARS